MNIRLVVLLNIAVYSAAHANAPSPGCLYTEDHCAASSWSEKIEGGKTLSYIAVSGNVLTLTMKTYKRDAQLKQGISQALDDLNLFSGANTIREFEPDHDYLFHPTYSHNHFHLPLYRNWFPFLAEKWSFIASFKLEKILNSFRINEHIVWGMIKNIEPDIEDAEVTRIVQSFRERQEKVDAPRRVFSSMLTARFLEESLRDLTLAAIAIVIGAAVMTEG